MTPKTRIALCVLLLAAARSPEPGLASLRAGPPPCARAPAVRTHLPPDTLRAGISLGGTHRVGLSLEVLRGRNSLEVSVGTFRFELLTLALTARRYFGEDRLHPYAGAGLWMMLAFPGEDFGYLALVRMPVGLDWNVSGAHYGGAEASLNWAFAVNRADPQDHSPLRRHFLPLPALYYKYRRTR